MADRAIRAAVPDRQHTTATHGKSRSCNELRIHRIQGRARYAAAQGAAIGYCDVSCTGRCCAPAGEGDLCSQSGVVIRVGDVDRCVGIRAGDAKPGKGKRLVPNGDRERRGCVRKQEGAYVEIGAALRRSEIDAASRAVEDGCIGIDWNRGGIPVGGIIHVARPSPYPGDVGDYRSCRRRHEHRQATRQETEIHDKARLFRHTCL